MAANIIIVWHSAGAVSVNASKQSDYEIDTWCCHFQLRSLFVNGKDQITSEKRPCDLDYWVGFLCRRSWRSLWNEWTTFGCVRITSPMVAATFPRNVARLFFSIESDGAGGLCRHGAMLAIRCMVFPPFIAWDTGGERIRPSDQQSLERKCILSICLCRTDGDRMYSHTGSFPKLG